MDYTLNRESLEGKLQLPSSKSQTLRALIFGFLAEGTSIIQNPLKNSPDIDSMVSALQALGASIEKKEGCFHVLGGGGKLNNTHLSMDTGGSGIVYRFITGLLSLAAGAPTLTDKFLGVKNRPITPLLTALKNAGSQIEFLEKENALPYKILGRPNKNIYSADGSDSQTVSALLILAAFRKEPIELHITNPGEIPWIKVTLKWLRNLGISVTHNEDFSKFNVHAKERIEAFNYKVPADYSSLMYPLGMALVSDSCITIDGIDLNDDQGDKIIVEKLQEMGAKIEVDKKNAQIRVLKGSSLRGITIDMSLCIDAIAFFAVMGCFASTGVMRLVNASIARTKECDRISSTYKELKKMGANIREREDGLIIYPSALKPATLLCYNDHRMVLALSVAAFGLDEKSTLKDTACINKTYGSFAKDMNGLGAKIKEIG
ncbi:3-phosphoshikimate 1-carboxyvinyltransferase [Candidatus Aerophobetes bacterium]|uniref:3-phosphoshikimate 1-carboxyvinyltransferase n=1 Tax=Aerophobetes bacterium TaxID=2030807 RepID=A0A2A4WZW8_UNCAE|nr:MAG: 3-phosphoshikimate 1-carboxyvinyltransferase [Candidatus Aerophobetes bacterium]